MCLHPEREGEFVKVMKQFKANHIVNLAIAGHSGAGKTSLAEAMLYLAGASDRRGKVGDGNTVCDFDPEEIRRKASVSSAVAPFEWKNTKINLLDAPGLFDFEGSLWEAARAADTMLITVSGKSGVEVGTEKPLPLRRNAAFRRFSSSMACVMKAPVFTAYLKI